MNATKPHYLLFSESNRQQRQGHWRFVLQALDGSQQFEAADTEPNTQGERLELLAVVRGLEAVPTPARVTLVTPSKYVNRGLTQGLSAWRTNDWRWEHFGEMVPVKNRDLWQRVDRALGFHQVECRTWRFDLPHVSNRGETSAESADLSPVHGRTVLPPTMPANAGVQRAEPAVLEPKKLPRARRRGQRWRLQCQRSWINWRQARKLWLGSLGLGWLPMPWLE